MAKLDRIQKKERAKLYLIPDKHIAVLEKTSRSQDQHDLSNAVHSLTLIARELKEGWKLTQKDSDESVLIFEKSLRVIKKALGIL